MDASRYIHNACLIPPIRPDSEVTVDANGTPDWASTLILCEVRIATATKEGTLEAAVAVLEHYAEMGVNGLWLCPVYDPGDSGNGYSNIGPHSIDPAITGTDDYAEGWRVLRRFVDEAHKRNIRILLDVISWGTVNESPLYAAHPDWYTGNSVWGGREFNFANEAFTAWYIDEVVGIALKTGCDGFRYDVEPSYAGYAVDGEIRRRLLQQGKKIFTVGEVDNERGGAYDVEQGGVTGTVTEEHYQAPEPIYFMLDRYDLVDSIRSGEHLGSVAAQEKGMGGRYRYYTNCLSCHDNRYPVAHGNRLAFGYAMLYSPFIPLWYIGEEWNAPRDSAGVLYHDRIDWDTLGQEENRAFYEDVKTMLRIRRQYPEIFAVYPEEFIRANICRAETTGGGLQAYARYTDGMALLIVPNNTLEDGQITVTLPFAACGLNRERRFTVTDAVTDAVIVQGRAEEVETITVYVPRKDQRVLKVAET